jgi:hypothetical protein
MFFETTTTTMNMITSANRSTLSKNTAYANNVVVSLGSTYYNNTLNYIGTLIL